MNQFCNKKRKRDKEEGENEYNFAIPGHNNKILKSEISYPQESSELSDLSLNDSNINNNICINKTDQNSISTMHSKNDQKSTDTNNSFFFNVKQNDEIIDFKKIENKFEEIQEEKPPLIKSKSTIIDINIRQELLSSYSSYYSNNSYKNSSSYYSYSNSSKEEYYPYQVGEMVDKQYLVSNNFLFFINFYIGGKAYI